ncbi:hypothetical protein CS953_00570 [Bacillus safensis]|uniref:AAA family ATPase n=1 Tax=Bacillus safensis TaxID=561879 RepID=UPI000EF31C37|nr:AAA family ATPase [Bacillus safensis]AYJ88261.1 hypothetical protein CS953_00570 [Bacillus safensis]
MILGVFLNGYKSYPKSVFIPITSDVKEKYSVYIGTNGIGKSGILEAIDVFFNNREWNANRGSKKEECYITPIFMIEKEILREFVLNKNRFNKIEIKENELLLHDIEVISAQFWNGIQNSLVGATRREYAKIFFSHLEQLIGNYSEEKYYILPAGIKYNGKSTLTPFDSHYRKLLGEDNFEKKIDRLRKILKEYYAYIYIPVEQNVDETLKLEDRQMQTLMNKDILYEIDNVLNSKYEIEGKNRSFLNFTNDYLNEFIKGINSSIKQIDENYNYSAEAFSKKNLTVTDIRDKIIEAYFSKRPLRYKNREVNQLSSGEKRKALIDIAYAFLSNSKEMDREVILAIDEPEVSMNIANCFPQFMRLQELASNFKRQVLITTHWYGSLPITDHGYLYHLRKEEQDVDIKISDFNFFDYLDEQRRFPDDIELKSMFDLASSIISFSKSVENINWIICEGSTDRLYLENLLDGLENFRVLPVGGCGNVIKLYGLLSYPLSDKLTADQFSGKILCLIDTDSNKVNVTKAPESKGKVDIRRIQTLTSNNIEAVKFLEPWRQGQFYERTVIEDCLNPQNYYTAVQRVIEEEGDEYLRTLFQKFEFNTQISFSKILGDKSILIPKDNDAFNNKEHIVEFINNKNIKMKIAKNYIDCTDSNKNTNELLKDEVFNYFGVTNPKYELSRT